VYLGYICIYILVKIVCQYQLIIAYVTLVVEDMLYGEMCLFVSKSGFDNSQCLLSY
jgi:hypothetical protein